MGPGTSDEMQGLDRRQLFKNLAFLGSATSAVVMGAPLPALARGGPASPAELKRIKTGYEEIVAFLADFDAQTTVCKPECARNPDAVRTVLGLRDTKATLFQIEKVLSKAQDNVEDADDFEKYIQATEDWSSAVAESNSLSYTSSFGEYNPGGGKDAVEKYLQKSKEYVVLAKDSLKIICDVLQI